MQALTIASTQSAVLLVLTLAASANCQIASQRDVRVSDSTTDGNLTVVQKLIYAFNEHKPAAMSRMLHKDCEIYYVDEAGNAELSTNSADQLKTEMEKYFQRFTDATSKVENSFSVGRFVAIEERVEWTAQGEKQSQASLAVYEVSDSKIRRVTYYPAQK